MASCIWKDEEELGQRSKVKARERQAGSVRSAGGKGLRSGFVNVDQSCPYSGFSFLFKSLPYDLSLSYKGPVQAGSHRRNLAGLHGCFIFWMRNSFQVLSIGLSKKVGHLTKQFPLPQAGMGLVHLSFCGH